MKELKCPKCGNVFKVDEADYASIAAQVKTAEFDAELEIRMQQAQDKYNTLLELEAAKAQHRFSEKISLKERELETKAAEIDRLKSELKAIGARKDSERDLALAQKDMAIASLNSRIERQQDELKMAMVQQQQRSQEEIRKYEQTIERLRAEMEMEQFKARAEAEQLSKRHMQELQAKQEQIDYYRDMKIRMSTKMIGESLEVHCSTLFNQLLRPIMPCAYFEKDNTLAEGTKGDFIFRDYQDGMEYVSIMFEMKNEMDTTATKHRNEDFLKKLDEDRRKKGCEFAVLVSLLEPDSELYNGGIVDVSHRYGKMYVIRPQFFIPMITLLVQTSKKSLEYRKQLLQAQSREVDVTNFEHKLDEFRSRFGRHYELATKKFDDAIKQIDDTIAKLQKVKESLLGSGNNLRLANKDTEELTIRKLTYNNPTMKQKFAQAKDSASD